MHWFWRAAIAVGAGSVACLMLILFAGDTLAYLGSTNLLLSIAVHLSGIVVSQLLCLAAFNVLTLRYGGRTLDLETRCRKCNYILRGITEPRCPECGERI